MTLRVRGHLVATTAVALLCGVSNGFAQDSCSAYPTAKMDKIESTAVEAEFGAVPAPKKELRFAYVTKTLINEFWQDVAAGVKDEAGKHGIAVDVQAAKDESSMIEQLNLAQTVLSQKPDALLLSPQSDSNLAPVIEAARAANIPTIIIDDARTEGASTYVGTDQVSIGAKAAAFLNETLSGRRQGGPDRGRGRLAQRPAAHPGLQGGAGEVSEPRTGRQPARQLGPPDGSQRNRQYPAPDTRPRRHLCQQ